MVKQLLIFLFFTTYFITELPNYAKLYMNDFLKFIIFVIDILPLASSSFSLFRL